MTHILFLELLSKKKILFLELPSIGITNMEDRVRWKEAKDGIFSVKSFYSAMEGSSTVSFLKNIIWSPCAPSKVVFFVWEASWGKVLTLDQLKKRGWSLHFLCCWRVYWSPSNSLHQGQDFVGFVVYPF